MWHQTIEELLDDHGLHAPQPDRGDAPGHAPPDAFADAPPDAPGHSGAIRMSVEVVEEYGYMGDATTSDVLDAKMHVAILSSAAFRLSEFIASDRCRLQF